MRTGVEYEAAPFKVRTYVDGDFGLVRVELAVCELGVAFDPPALRRLALKLELVAGKVEVENARRGRKARLEAWRRGT